MRRPGFFAPAVRPADLRFPGKERFVFTSPFESGSVENDTARGVFVRAGQRWQDKPSVILLHGWNGELQYEWQFPFLAQSLARAGVNALRFELPYHSSRKPARPGAIRNFLSGNLLHVARATHQALAEVRALHLWLRAQGSPSVGVWGTSLGGWLSGLALAHQPDLDFGVLLTPVVRMDRALRELAFCDPIREQVNASGLDFSPLNLVAHPPRCSPENILLVVSRYDLLAPEETLDELERRWHAVSWRFPHGHISVLASPRIMRCIVRWIAARVLAPAASPRDGGETLNESVRDASPHAPK